MPNPTDIFGNLGWLNKWVKNLLGRVRALENGGGGGGTTPGIDTVLAEGQSLTANRSFGLGSNALEINPGYQVGLKLDNTTLEANFTGRYTTVGGGNTLDLNASVVNAGGGTRFDVSAITVYTNCETNTIAFGTTTYGSNVVKLEQPLLNTGHNTISANKLKITIDSVDYYIPLYT